MLKFALICLISLCLSQSLAEEKEKPVSLSYLNIIKCFPGLKNDQWSTKVNLNQLKDEADRKFVTTQSLLRYRQVLLKDSHTGQKKRLRLSGKTAKKGKPSYTLTIDKLDEKGAGVPVSLPQAQRVDPSQKVLDPYFLEQEVLEDEYSYFDTKLNGMSLSYKRNFNELFELEISALRPRRRVLCEDKKSMGVVCTCFEK